jgi:hypothetical protein
MKKKFVYQIGKNKKTYFVFSNSPPPPENRAVYETMWKNIVQRGRVQNTI